MTQEWDQKLAFLKQMIFFQVQFAQGVVELNDRMEKTTWLEVEFLKLKQIRTKKFLPQETCHENDSQSPENFPVNVVLFNFFSENGL